MGNIGALITAYLLGIATPVGLLFLLFIRHGIEELDLGESDHG